MTLEDFELIFDSLFIFSIKIFQLIDKNSSISFEWKIKIDEVKLMKIIFLKDILSNKFFESLPKFFNELDISIGPPPSL